MNDATKGTETDDGTASKRVPPTKSPLYARQVVIWTRRRSGLLRRSLIHLR